MKFSQLFSKTRKEAPKDEVVKNAQFLIRAGYIHKEMAGVYAYLPLGIRVLKNIENIIREEMNAIGAEEILLTALQNSELWKKTDRWEQDVWFKTQLKNGVEVGLGWTQEEQIVNLLSQHISSYKDLPKAIYQIQTKFRNEERAKSGIVRGREFIMKDMYSFHSSVEDLDAFYRRVQETYKNIFKRVGIAEHTFLTIASGGVFSAYSHEFQTISLAGEDTVYVSKEKQIAINAEVMNDAILSELNIKRGALTEHTAIEVGNIFKLGTRFSEPLGLFFKDEQGKKHPVVMGCYGLGPTRLMGTIVEILSDTKGIVWPEAVAPFQVHLVPVSSHAMVLSEAQKLYERLTKTGCEVLYDDRDISAGVKFADADLIGIPWIVILGESFIKKNVIEVVERATGEKNEMDITALVKQFNKKTQ